MLPLLILSIILIVIFVPQFWVQMVMKKYKQHIDELPGTGSELAEHLVKQFKLEKVSVDIANKNNDHYDPEEKTIRLSESNYHGKSLTAITVAAHEFGHALQDHMQYKPLLIRTRIAKIAATAEKIASPILVSMPFVILLIKIPIFNMILLLAGLSIMGLPIILHLSTLPVEFDASFNRALPILEKGHYLPPSAMPIAKKILTAAAFTYVAGSLASLLNFYRWIAVLKR